MQCNILKFLQMGKKKTKIIFYIAINFVNDDTKML